MDARQALFAVLLGSSVAVASAPACNSDPMPVITAQPTATGGATAGAAGASGAPAAAPPASAGAPATAAPGATPPADYSVAANWLCRPGHNTICESDLSSTIVNADGTLQVEPFEANPAAPIDCFYVYPTISNDTTPNSDLNPGPEEEGVVVSQFARFGSQCRLFAPVYRQVTLGALRAALGGGGGAAPDRALGYNDVVAAWKYYLEHDNQGRGVVLVGHSQGAGVLAQLIKDQLDKAPLDKRLIAGLLIGTNITVPAGAAVGGMFQNVPLCTTPEQLGCIISYMSFRATNPPPASSMFARSTDPNLTAGCTNPAALGGGSAPLHAYLTAKGTVLSGAPTPPWTVPEKPVDTPYVSVPGLLTGECVPGANGSPYFSITINADPNDARTDEIVGDVLANGEVVGDWGLHVIDVHLAIGNLVDLVKAKTAAYAAP
jgi:hypothetical protein